MADDDAGYERPSGTLRNVFNTDDEGLLNEAERRLSASRLAEIQQGLGPKGRFDEEHLKALHRHLFQDVYPWAGHMRSEAYTVDGNDYRQIGILRKGTTTFLPSSRFGMGFDAALEPIMNRTTLAAASNDEFATRVGNTLGQLNYIHPFREGNGRTQRAFIEELGRSVGRNIDLGTITQARMTAASEKVAKDPDSRALIEAVYDASTPSHVQAINEAFKELEAANVPVEVFEIRAVRPGEQVKGALLYNEDRTAAIVTDDDILVLPGRDTVGLEGDIDLTIKTSFDEIYPQAERQAENVVITRSTPAVASVQALPFEAALAATVAKVSSDADVDRSLLNAALPTAQGATGDPSVLTDARLQAIAISPTKDADLAHAVVDATDPIARAQLAEALKGLGEKFGADNTKIMDVRTAQFGQENIGKVLMTGTGLAALTTPDRQILVGDRRDFDRPDATLGQTASMTASSEGRNAQIADRFMQIPREQAELVPQLKAAHQVLGAVMQSRNVETTNDPALAGPIKNLRETLTKGETPKVDGPKVDNGPKVARGPKMKP